MYNTIRLFAIKIPSEPVDKETFDKLAGLVDSPARERLARFRLPDDALRSLVARLTVTWYLYTNGLLSPGELPTFGRKAKGKPTLSTPKLEPRLEFNNTHEGSYILLTALRSHSPLACVGIDIMKHPDDPFPTQEGISDQLTLLEKRSLAMPLSARDRSLRLTKLWSVKEAYTKAIGEGITFGLERIEVELSAGAGKVERVKVDGKDVDERGWEWRVGDIGDDYGWAAWWRGDDVERELVIDHISWEDFARPLLVLAESRLTSNT
ncbi:hypothetical protein I308_104090 [Cryptococcus tetragattii IND107]|uniref:holo-[acyl-carrier-protein] synthase n=1 Tax=Cryptococcus tetragattii IND107 TaxID=1296105 RepID=A0ABR3BPC9_9TREE|nr:4'-phosphopantetheinyl transferase [Cryptococcus tetragattii IND107]